MPSQADDEKFLHKGWDWLEGHADHDPLPENYHALEEEWLRRLRQYEEAYRLVTTPIHRTTPKGARPDRRVAGGRDQEGTSRQTSF